AFRRLRLGCKHRSPVAERLQRNALRFAILPLVQVTTLPRLMVRTPERLVLASPSSVLVRHLVLLNLQIESENRSCLRTARKVCEKWTLTSTLTFVARNS